MMCELVMQFFSILVTIIMKDIPQYVHHSVRFEYLPRLMVKLLKVCHGIMLLVIWSHFLPPCWTAYLDGRAFHLMIKLLFKLRLKEKLLLQKPVIGLYIQLLLLLIHCFFIKLLVI